MLPILDQYLVSTQPFEMVELYQRADCVLREMNLEDFDSEFDELLMASDSTDVSNLNDSIRALYTQLCMHAIDTHAIKVSDSASLSSLVTLLEFIKQLDCTEFVESAVIILSQEDKSCEERWSELMVEVIGGEMCDYDFVEEVTERTIAAALLFFTKRESFEVVSTESPLVDAPDRLKALEKYATVQEVKNSAAYQYAFTTEGVLGLPYEHYFDTLYESMDAGSAATLARELIALCYLAQEGYNNPTGVIMPCLSKRSSDLNELTLIQVAIAKEIQFYYVKTNSGVTTN